MGKTRAEAIAEIMSTYLDLAVEFASTQGDVERTLEEGRAALRALGVTEDELGAVRRG